MGIAPLSAWTATSLKRLGDALIIPTFLTVLIGCADCAAHGTSINRGIDWL